MKIENKLEPARPEDGPALLELIESQASAGELALMYTRRPDPVSSILSESPCVSLRVIRDSKGIARFMESCVERRVFLGGKAVTIPYIGNIRKSPGTLPGVNWLRMLCATDGVKYSTAFCSILKGNQVADRIFCQRRRPYAPYLRPLCSYRTFLFAPQSVKGKTDKGFFRLSEKDRGEWLAFLNHEGRNVNFFPAIKDLELEFHGLRIEDCYGIRQNGTLVACGAIWDQRMFRQYIVKEYQGIYALAWRFPIFTRMLGYIPLPNPGITANVRVLSLLCAKSAGLFQSLLVGLAREASRDSPILAAGAAESDSCFKLFSSFRSIGFDSTIYSIAMPGQADLFPQAQGRIHLELGWL